MELRPTIDREWLDRASKLDPFGHAYARWDLDHAPYRVRFVSALDGDRTVGYLLVWLGHPTTTVVHWVGSDPRARALVDALPPRPLVAIVPEVFQNAAVQARGPARPLTVLLLTNEPASEPRTDARSPSSVDVRRLERVDHPALVAFAERQSDPVTGEYPALDPGEEWIWGAFDQGKLVGAVRAAVRLSDVLAPRGRLRGPGGPGPRGRSRPPRECPRERAGGPSESRPVRSRGPAGGPTSLRADGLSALRAPHLARPRGGVLPVIGVHP